MGRLLLLSLFSKTFEKPQRLAKLWEKVDCLKCPVRRAPARALSQAIVLDGTQLPLPRKGVYSSPTPLFGHVCCGQTIAMISLTMFLGS